MPPAEKNAQNQEVLGRSRGGLIRSSLRPLIFLPAS